MPDIPGLGTGDWGRDTMISLPGITLTTGRTEIARTIIRTFARYLDQGMLPNVFPEVGEQPDYSTVIAIASGQTGLPALLSWEQQRTIVDTCG